MGKKIIFPALGLFLISLIIIAALYYAGHIESKIFFSLVWGAAIACLNFTGALISVKVSLNKRGKSSINAYLLGVAIRLPVILLVLIISLLFLDINDNSFIFSVLIFYVYFLMIEILYLTTVKR